MKYFILALLIIGMALSTIDFFHHYEINFVVSQILVGIGVLFSTFNIFKQKLSKGIFYLFMICFSLFLLFDVYRLGKLLLF
ncbi:hypothetical protein ABES02_28335 [Neobacillus pocheonensis]|uniref:hypothetical protein n=1 Tax=Neobacillus pocheonensis TaxID=363869 RepID=UPI003D2D1494